MGGSGPNSFQKAAPLQLFIAHVHPLLLFLLSILYTLSPTCSIFLSSPQGLDKYSFYLFLLSHEDSLHLFLMPFIFSCFCDFVYHIAYLSCFLPRSVSCCLFVFPLSFCHHKLPPLSVSPSQRITPSICKSLSSASTSHSRTLSALFPPCHLSLHPSFIPPRAAGCLQPSRVRLVSW